jgi:hypothetical protein
MKSFSLYGHPLFSPTHYGLGGYPIFDTLFVSDVGNRSSVHRDPYIVKLNKCRKRVTAKMGRPQRSKPKQSFFFRRLAGVPHSSGCGVQPEEWETTKVGAKQSRLAD